MTFGLSKDHWQILDAILIAPLKDRGADVFVFGSRATNKHQKFSDIDVLVDTQEDLSLQLSLMKEKLEESQLPIKVDLVLRKDLANAYKEQIEREKIKI